MTTPLPPDEEELDRDPELDALETAVSAAITAAIAAALAYANRPAATAEQAARNTALAADALRAAEPELVDAFTDAVNNAIRIDGIGDQQARSLTADLAIAAAVAYIIGETARAITSLLIPVPVVDAIRHAVYRLWREAVTLIHAARNRGVWWVARASGRQVVWRTRRDERVCPVCGPMDGVVGSVDGFAADTEWSGFSQLPPAHPFCRCTLQTRTRP